MISGAVLMSTGPVHTTVGCSESSSDRVTVQVKTNGSPALIVPDAGMIATEGGVTGMDEIEDKRLEKNHESVSATVHNEKEMFTS